MANVAIIGAGLIGRAWALVYARGGHRVRLWDSQPAQVGQALAFAREVAPGLAQAGLLRGRTVDQLLAALEPSGMEDALRDADRAGKHARTVGQQASRLCRAGSPGAGWRDPGQLDLGAAAFAFHGRPAWPRAVAHPINPPYLVPAVEIVPAPWTDAACVERARAAFLAEGRPGVSGARSTASSTAAGRAAARGVPGWPMATPASRTWTPASATVWRCAWAFMGPFETIDLNAPAGVRDTPNATKACTPRCSSP